MSSTSSFDLFSLPELVVKMILSQYLDFRSLKVLRLTCRKVNGLIERNPAVLKRFRIVIRGNEMERVTAILDSKIPWNNVYTYSDDNNALTHNKDMFSAKLEDLSKLLANHLKIIEGKTESDNDVSCSCFLLNSASTLEVVNLHYLDLESVKSVNKAMEIVQKFPQLKVLDVKINDGLKLRNFLMKCPQLRRLIIHHAGMEAKDVDGDLVQPLKDYLNYRLTQSIHLPLEIRLDNTWPWEVLDPIPLADLIQIARLSFQVNTTLENIPMAFLPTYGDVTKGGWNLKKYLDASIRSVVSYGERFNDQYIPSNSQISANVDLEADTDFTGFELPHDVHSIIIRVRFGVLIPEATGLIDRLLHSRPSLKELSVIGFGKYRSNYLIRFDGLPNLTKLQLCRVGTKDEDLWKIYEALPLLEVLILEACSSLRDESIIGPEVEGDNRSMLNLKYLKHLKINKTLKTTDITFKKIFSQMKLLTFEVFSWCRVEKEAGMTLAAVEALQQGIFGGMVQFIKIDRPDRATDSELKNILQKCKHLKKFELVETTPWGFKTVIHL